MYFQPEDNHKTIIAKRGKVLRNYRFKHKLKMTFHWGWNVREKVAGQAAIPRNFKRRCKRSPYDFGVLIYQFTVITWILFNRPVMSTLEVIYHHFFQLWLIFPNQNYQSRSKEYNFNWCWHRTLPLKKKRFSVFENLLKTSGTTTKVLSCPKIPLNNMHFIASFQTSPILPFPSHPPDWSLNPLEETLLKPVLKSFITVLL